MGKQTREMKLIATLLAISTAERMSLISGQPQGECGGRICGFNAASTCMKIDQAAIDYFGKRIGKIGDEKCSCIFQHRWHMSQGRHFQVVASKTPECVYKVLEEYRIGSETFEGNEINNFTSKNSKFSIF